MTIRRIYIIGAGASVPYGLPTLKRLTWELAESLPDAERGVFIAAVRECFATDLRRPEDSPDFEELLNRLDPRALEYLCDSGLSVQDSPRARALEVALAGLRAFIRDKCCNSDVTDGPFDVLVRALEPGSILISFNWDILLELALLRSGRTYCYLPSRHRTDSDLLLKPHGSINWYALLDREMLLIAPGSNIHVVGDDLSNYLCYANEPLRAFDFKDCTPTVENALSRVPAIVPPTASKVLAVGGIPRDGFVAEGHDRAMRSIWKAIASALEQASELVIIGYSLPGTDAGSIAAFKHFSASATSTNPKQILLVEPNSAVTDRYQSILGVPARIICTDFKRYDPR